MKNDIRNFYRDLSDRKIRNISAKWLQHHWDADELRFEMLNKGTNEYDIANDLDIPVQRVRAAMKSGRYDGECGYIPNNPNMECVRTLIGIYLQTGLWKDRQKDYENFCKRRKATENERSIG